MTSLACTVKGHTPPRAVTPEKIAEAAALLVIQAHVADRSKVPGTVEFAARTRGRMLHDAS